MKSINIEADPLVTKTITSSIDFKAPANDSFADHEQVMVITSIMRVISLRRLNCTLFVLLMLKTANPLGLRLI